MEETYIKVESTKEKRIVHASVYDPSRPGLFKTKANENAECCVVSCSNSDNCGLFKRGECAMLAILGSTRCPYGSKQYYTGPTSRARNFHDWIGDKVKVYGEHLNKLKIYNQRMAIIGDYVFLPYAHMNMNEKLPFEHKGGFMSNGTHFIHMSQFTVELVKKIINFTPYTIMGDAITSYQKEVVPKFLVHLKETMPDLFQKLVAELPEVNSIVTSYSNVGRKALLSSLKPGTVVTKYHNSKNLKTQHWTWDGEYLTSTDADVSFPIVDYTSCEIKMKPKVGAAVEITSDEQVDEGTEYVD